MCRDRARCGGRVWKDPAAAFLWVCLCGGGMLPWTAYSRTLDTPVADSGPRAWALTLPLSSLGHFEVGSGSPGRGCVCCHPTGSLGITDPARRRGARSGAGAVGTSHHPVRYCTWCGSHEQVSESYFRIPKGGRAGPLKLSVCVGVTKNCRRIPTRPRPMNALAVGLSCPAPVAPEALDQSRSPRGCGVPKQ